MESVKFTRIELQNLERKQLASLLAYYGLSTKGTKAELIDRLDTYYHPKQVIPQSDIDYGQILLPDETPEEPKYSVKVRRIYWSQHMEDLKNGT